MGPLICPQTRGDTLYSTSCLSTPRLPKRTILSSIQSHYPRTQKEGVRATLPNVHDILLVALGEIILGFDDHCSFLDLALDVFDQSSCSTEVQGRQPFWKK